MLTICKPDPKYNHPKNVKSFIDDVVMLLEETLFPSQFLFSMRNLNSNGGINSYAPLVELSTPPNVAAHCTTGALTKTASSIYPIQTQLTASFKLICLSLLKPYPCSPFIRNLLPQHLHYLQWHYKAYGGPCME